MTLHFASDTFAAATFDIHPLQPKLGAEIGGIDLRQPIDDAQRDGLYAALLRYKVLFFRDQDITRDQHIAFASAFGDLEVAKRSAHPEYPHVAVVSDRAGADGDWQADGSFRREPSTISIQRTIGSAAIGGETLFADAIAAYEALDADTRARIAGLTAVHRPDPATDPFADHPHIQHPVVRYHPETGAKLLFVNPAFTRHIIGLNHAESDALLARLFDQISRPAFHIRFGWTPNSVALWDSRAIQHHTAPDPERPLRIERVTIVGERPVGPRRARHTRS
jgi:taurine dioxygenase